MLRPLSSIKKMNLSPATSNEGVLMMVERSGLDLSPSASPDRSPNASPPHTPVPIDLTELRSHFMLQPDNKPERPCGRYDITRHLSEPQSVAARKLGIPV